MLLNKKCSKGLINLVCCTIFALSCSSKPQKPEINEQFTQILSELMTIENMTSADSIKAKLIVKKLNEYGIKIQDIRQEIYMSDSDPEHWQKLYSNIKELLKDEPVKY